jgi:hypothetical protein
MDYSGMASAASQAFSKELMPETQAARSEARFKKAESEENLRRLQATKPTDSDLRSMAEQQSLKIQQQEMQLKELMATQVKKTTYEGLDRFFEDGDARHLRQTIQDIGKTEIGRSLFGDQLSNVATLTDSENDRKLIEGQLGANPDLILGHPELKKKYVKVLDNKGTEKIVDLTTFVGTTDYNQYAQTKKLDLQNKMATLEKGIIDAYPLAKETKYGAAIFIRLQGLGLDPNSAEFQTKFADAYETAIEAEHAKAVALQELKNKGKAITLSADEQAALDTPWLLPKNSAAERAIHAEVVRQLSDKGELHLYPHGTKEYFDLYTTIARKDKEQKNLTPMQKDANALEPIYSTMDNLAKEMGEQDFMSAPADVAAKIKVRMEPEIAAMEEKYKLPPTMLKDIADYSTIIKMGDRVVSMSADETGAFDKLMFGAEKYLSDDIKGIRASAAYNAVRNELRHKFFGSALTPAEIQSFQAQWGDQAMQLGPALAYFKENMETTKQKIESTAEVAGNSRLLKLKTGASVEQADIVISNIQKIIDSLQTGTPENAQQADAVLSKAEKKREAQAKLEAMRAKSRGNGQ